MAVFKRFQYWGSENGRPVIKWSDFYPWDSDYKPKYQLKPKLLNEYREEV